MRLRNETQWQFEERTIKRSGKRPYDVYTALVTQSGSNAPVATVLETTFNDPLTWTRTGTGTYSVGFSGSFPVSGTFCAATVHPTIQTTGGHVTFGQLSTHTCRLKVYNSSSFAPVDNFNKPISVEIRAYNV